jgi:hypothetical protein
MTKLKNFAIAVAAGFLLSLMLTYYKKWELVGPVIVGCWVYMVAKEFLGD